MFDFSALLCYTYPSKKRQLPDAKNKQFSMFVFSWNKHIEKTIYLRLSFSFSSTGIVIVEK